MGMLINTRYENSMTSKELKKERKFIFISIFSLTLFGILMVYEASGIYAFKETSDAAFFLKRQLSFLFVGLIFFYIFLFLDLNVLRRYNKSILVLTILSLIGLFIYGNKAGGARRWLSLFGVNIQPSELLKISFLLYTADYCNRKNKLIKNIRYGLLPLGLVLGLICILLVSQPDLGTSIFWVLWTILFVFIWGAKLKHLASVALLGSIGLFFLITLYPYRFRRITAYLNPFADSQGAGFQLVQSQIAYGVGGLLGVGFGESRQKLFFLPAAHTDFIYSIIAEEFGLLGALGILFIFIILFYKMIKISNDAKDNFKKGILIGITLIFGLEVILNIGVSCGLFPTKGLSLPFISYGGSNLVVHYILLGLFFNASQKEDKSLNNFR